MTNKFLDAALAWASEGFYIHPCLPGRKEPATEHGCKDATTDADTIRRWWQENPEYNPACAPGMSDHTVIDIDPPLGQETLNALTREHGLLPQTFTCSTPRGGTHLWFEGATRNSSNHLGPKIDTRSHGGYVLIPPSVIAPGQYANNPNGGSYAIAQAQDITPTPIWVTNSLEAKTDRQSGIGERDLPANIERATRLLRSYVERLDIATEGVGGDDRTYRLCCEVIDLGLSAGTAFELIRDIWNPACEPPWDEDELWKKVENASEYHQNETGAYAVESPEVAFAHIAPEHSWSDGSPEPGERVRLVTLNPRFKLLSRAEQRARKPVEWLIPGLIQAKSVAVFYGKKKSFKSFLTLDLTLGISTGSTVFGYHVPKPLPCVYAIGESADAVLDERLPAWELAHQQTADNFWAIATVPRANRMQEAFDLILQTRAAGVQPAVVVIDTMARSMRGLNENDVRDVGAFMDICDLIKDELQCAVIVVHHASDKPGKNGPRGSSGLSADPETIIEVIRHEKTLAVEAWVRDQRNAQESETPYTFQGKPIAGSLVFFPTDAAAHRAIKDAGDPIARDLVYATLQGLHAESEADAVTVDVLASTLCSASPDDVKPVVQKLKKAAKPGGPLEAYQKNGAWFISR